MRRKDRIFDPFAESPVDGVIAAQCALRVISGQFLSDKKVGTYVEVDMYGLPTDTIRKEFRTRMVPSNGLNPMYNEEEPFMFRKVVLPDLAVIRIAVYDENGKMIGQRILPMDGLQAGYRHISLRTEGNFPMSLPMLFISIELKIYVPDGLGEFMNALSDPRAFLSAQEKRIAQMKAMGIEETDIQQVQLNKQKEEEARKENELKMDPIPLEKLRNEKAYLKLMKKQEKEFAGVRKKQEKEKQLTQKSQVFAIDKLLKSLQLDAAPAVPAGPNDPIPSDNPQVMKLAMEQISQWTEMVERHNKEQWDLLRAHCTAQRELLKKLLSLQQAGQVKTIEARFDKENKDMKAAQARISVETAKEVAKEVANDKALRNKAERERRIREKNSNNTKKFIEERKTAAIKQQRERDKLMRAHERQMAELEKECEQVRTNLSRVLDFRLTEQYPSLQAIEMYDTAEAEYKMMTLMEGMM